jgi:uncharacterized protein DUF5317
MFILYAIPAGLLAGFALGGRLEGLSRLQVRWAWVFILGLAVQLVLFSDAVASWIGDLGPPIYVASTFMVAVAIARNWRIRGLPIVLAGAASNLAAIVANGGYMPASAEALASLGYEVKDGYSNSSFVANAQLPWLTDIFALPRWLPAANVFSIGDVLIGVGIVVVIAIAMRSARTGRGADAAAHLKEAGTAHTASSTTPDLTPAD